MTKTTHIVLPLSIFLTRKSEDNLMVKLEWSSFLQINYSKRFYFSAFTESRPKAKIYPKINFWNYNVIFILHFQQSARLSIFVILWVLMLILHVKRSAENANLTRKCNFKKWFLMKIWLKSYLETSNWLTWPFFYRVIRRKSGSGQLTPDPALLL